VLGEIVRVVNKSGLFVVLNVDADRRVAQLMEKFGKHRLSTAPFASVQPFNRSLSKAIERFLDVTDHLKAQEHTGDSR
jgi:hypothetical protein